MSQAGRDQQKPAASRRATNPERKQNSSTQRARSTSRVDAGSPRTDNSRRSSRQNEAVPRNRANVSRRQKQSTGPRHFAPSLGQSRLTNNIFPQNRVGGSLPSSKSTPIRASHANTKVAPKRKTVVACIALLVVLIICGIDGFLNGNKIYDGVVIGDVSVGGLTKDEAIDCVSGEYSQRVSSNVATFFTTQENLNNPKACDTDANIEEQISYEESLANRTQWTVPGNEVEATLDVDSLVEQAFEVGRSDGSIIGRIGAGIFGKNIPLTCSYSNEKVSSLADQMTSAVGEKRVNFGISINDGIASVTNGNDGNEVTAEWLTDRLNETFLGTESLTKTVVETQYMPLQANEEDAQRVANTVNASIAAGATFVYEDQTWNVSSSDLGNLITTDLSEDGGKWKLSPVFDESKRKMLFLRPCIQI